MEAMSGLPTTHSFTFYPGEDELIQFEEGFYNTDLPNPEISNLVSDYSSTSSSSSSSHVSSSTGNIPISIDQTISRVNTNPNSSTLVTENHSTFQSHVMSFIRIQRHFLLKFPLTKTRIPMSNIKKTIKHRYLMKEGSHNVPGRLKLNLTL
ncbi:hypothetical protein ACTFIW_008868 [Dictyostelium discoideum]